MGPKNLEVLRNIIAGVESGGQVYGRIMYEAYAGPRENTQLEHTVTLGWQQSYGIEAMRLIKMIRDADPEAFRRIDKCTPSIESMIGYDWDAICWEPTKEQKTVLIMLITSAAGIDAQDRLWEELASEYIRDCAADWTPLVKAQMMYVEIRHLGGRRAADRIFMRCNDIFTLGRIREALRADQTDQSSSTQVGDRLFDSRHDLCVKWIEEYAKEEVSMDALARAKALLCQSKLKTMTGYTPEGKQCFADAGRITRDPDLGSIVYFYSQAKGRVGHTGIVCKVDRDKKMIWPVEGNTSSTEYAENGGCVAMHCYSYSEVGGTSRINCFGTPDWAAAGIDAQMLISTAMSYIGYLEKRTEAQLDDFTANAGYANYQKFQRDVQAGNGDEWCQYYVDAIALYACQSAEGGAYMFTVETVRKGSVSKDVSLLQTLLRGLGYTDQEGRELSIDGDFGARTEYAVKAYQDDCWLEVDGIVGVRTWASLLGI